MQTYFFPIKIAFITFPLLASFTIFIFAIYQYRKYGYINKYRILILYSFLLYLLVSYYLIILPLPSTTDVRSLQRENTQYYQLIPFNFIFEFLKETKVTIAKPSTFINVLTERAFLQAAFNGILLTPLGIYLRYYFRKDLKKTILITFLVSLFFEITQLTGLYGIYNAPYRLFDVDDLMLNTFGGFIGYLIAPVFTFFLPQSSELDKNINLKEIYVSYFRRIFAFSLDWFLLGFIPYIDHSIITKGIVVFIYFILVVYFTNGKTIGKAIFKIKIKGMNEKLSFKEVLIRYGILYYGVFGINELLFKTIDLNKTQLAQYIIIVMLLVVVFNIILFIHVFLCVFNKDKILFYEKISKTKNVVV